MIDFSTGQDFGVAVCRHFGLQDAMVGRDIRVSTGGDEAFGVTLTIYMSPDDLAGIAAHMGGRLPASIASKEAGATRVDPLDFDAWMRLRTEKAHAEYQHRMSMLSADDAIEAEERKIAVMREIVLTLDGIQ